MRHNRTDGIKLVDSQARKSERREDLLRVRGAMGLDVNYLSNPTRWYELARDRMSYDPDRQLIEMLRDVARTVKAKGSLAQQQSVRRAITLYICKTLLNQCLEPLGQEDYSGKVLTMYQDSIKEVSEAECATAQALQAPAPHTDERAARELEEAAVAIEHTAISFRDRARKFVARSFDNSMRGHTW